MAPLESNVRKLPTEATQPYRTAPHNIEAEQALLGAILVNNEAFYRVSDFLESRHFFEPVHQKIYEIGGSLIRAGKVASPVTLKLLPADADIGGGMTVSQYLAARRRSHDLDQRARLRADHLRSIDAPLADPDRRGDGERGVRRTSDSVLSKQIEEAERKLF